MGAKRKQVYDWRIGAWVWKKVQKHEKSPPHVPKEPDFVVRTVVEVSGEKVQVECNGTSLEQAKARLSTMVGQLKAKKPRPDSSERRLLDSRDKGSWY